MPHPARARAEDRDVGAALALQLQLRVLDAGAQLFVADFQRAFLRLVLRIIFELRLLQVAIVAELLRRRRVVAVTIDDHEFRYSDSSVVTYAATARICSSVSTPLSGGILPRPSVTVAITSAGSVT